MPRQRCSINPESPNFTTAVKFYSFATRQTKNVAGVGQGLSLTDQGFSVSSDGKQILYTHTDRAEYDLMLVENFR